MEQIKNSVAQQLGEVNLSKKDRNFLLDLIKLFDALAKTPEDEFMNRLISAIDKSGIEDREEFNIRVKSLFLQLEQRKFTEVRHFQYFSLYISKHEAQVYIKKVSADFNLLISEIRKFEFSSINLVVYKTATKKEKILAKKLSPKKDWEKEIINTMENNICTNVQMIVKFPKEPLKVDPEQTIAVPEQVIADIEQASVDHEQAGHSHGKLLKQMLLEEARIAYSRKK